MAENSNGGPRISVSQELLRAEFNELKLWILMTFASAKDVEDLGARVRQLEDESISAKAVEEKAEAAVKKGDRKQAALTGVVATAMALLTGAKEAGIF